MLRYALIAALALTATPAAAQSFLKGLARSAAEAAIRGAVDRAISPSQATADEEGDDYAEATPAEAAPTATQVRYVYDIPKPADAADKKKAFEAFSRYSCDACEGGRAYDAWAQQILGVTGYRAWPKKVGALAVGERITWKGHVSNGELVVAAETEVHGFPCKQVTHRLTKGTEIAEREGLFCYGRATQYDGSPNWAEVY